ncbi:hypothetical protein A8709_13395 [Paenibacillus pectinilyticus]|uniref:ABC transporter substrate-binding protein n=1 Tax=Paenibacillus pectinilyticus TaxID=512399 RepID=A0A1C1A3P8_9BACL|nr:sugar ABC transporter substrate-binding protein [Paenibacillus pectinilyticus]OCT15100.1 hypothetical protein A8709_13395 [Paenibacillus pectinilyticus]
MKPLSKKMTSIAMIMALFVAAGCSSTKESNSAQSTNTASSQPTASAAATAKPKEKVIVNFAYPSFASAASAWDSAVGIANKQLESKNIEIKINKIPLDSWSVYYQKVISQIAAGDSPDIGRVAEGLFPKLIENGQVVDISDVVAKLDKTKYFENALHGSAVKDGKTYGVPSGIYNTFVYINKDLFDKAKIEYPSIDWNNPITMTKLVEEAKALTSGDGANKSWGFWTSLESGHLDEFLKGGGKGLYDDKGISELSDPANKKVLSYFDQMMRVDKSMPQATDTKVMGATDLFKAGKLAILVNGSWFFNEAKAVKFKVGLAAMPSEAGKGSSMGFLDGWAVFKGAKHEAEAKEAILALSSKEVNDFLSTTGEAGGPVVKSSLEDNKSKILGAPFIDSDISTYLGSLGNLVKSPYTTNQDDWTPKYNSAVEQFSLGKLSVDQFTAQADDIINKGNAAK